MQSRWSMTSVTTLMARSSANKNIFKDTRALRGLRWALPWLSLIACGDDSLLNPSNDAGKRDAGGTHAEPDAEAPQPLAAPLANRQLGRDAGCDLSGRWIMTEHESIMVMGSNQVAINWFYVELAQQGEHVTMTTAMSCGRTTMGLPAIEVLIDDSPAWPAYMKHVRYDGRKGTSNERDDQCHIAFDKAVLVRGATVSTYRDLSIPLPELEHEADGQTPGWEDWDDDGHPGVTMKVSGTIWGSIYEDSRSWSEYDGMVPRNAGSFMLGLKWQQERVTLGYDGSPILMYEGVRDSNAAQHAVELTRLLPEQATGDDAAKCRSIRELASSLTPNAAAKLLP